MTLVPIARIRGRDRMYVFRGFAYRGVLHDGSRFVVAVTDKELELARVGPAALVRRKLADVLEGWMP